MPNPFPELEREALYRILNARRDVRRGYTPEPLPDPLLTKILEAAHCAPSVGLSQPTRYLLIRSPETRQRIHQLFLQSNQQATESYTGDRQTLYSSLKLEGILEAPQNLLVLCDRTPAQGESLGRRTMPETTLYSTVCAIQNLWLAARAEGVGVGWVSILAPEALAQTLNIPAHLTPVAYLCLGFVHSFADAPDLERQGWQQRLPLKDVLYKEHF
jgi:5,6-dimethylbenzimidazole synthase